MVRYFWDHTCPTQHSNPPPLFHTITLSLGRRSTRVFYTCFLFLFLFLTHTNTHFTLSHPLPPVYPLPHHIHHHLSGKITGKSLRTSKHLHIFYFEVKFLILLVGFIFCLRLYFYLSFDNDTHVIYELCN